MTKFSERSKREPFTIEDNWRTIYFNDWINEHFNCKESEMEELEKSVEELKEEEKYLYF